MQYVECLLQDPNPVCYLLSCHVLIPSSSFMFPYVCHTFLQFKYCHSIQVMHWKSKVDRNVVERIRAFQNPPVLVGQVVEMVLVLIGKRLPSQRISEVKEIYSGKEDLSSHLSTSSGSSKLIVKKGQYSNSNLNCYIIIIK